MPRSRTSARFPSTEAAVTRRRSSWRRSRPRALPEQTSSSSSQMPRIGPRSCTVASASTSSATTPSSSCLPRRLGRVPALAVRGLEKRYGPIIALAGVDLEVGEGELVGLLGPNGAGKSTLVKIACGLVRASGGTARVRDSPAGSREARRRVGYLAELFRFPGWYSADELLELHQRLSGSTGGRAERDELLELVELSGACARR